MSFFPSQEKPEEVVVIRWYAVIKDSSGEKRMFMIPKKKAPSCFRFRVSQEISDAFVDHFGNRLNRVPENSVVKFSLVKRKNLKTKVFFYYMQENFLEYGFAELGIDNIN